VDLRRQARAAAGKLDRMPSESAFEAAAPAVPRLAATVAVLRDGGEGPEVLLVRRAERAGDRHAGAFVFPGGTVDAGDRALHALCDGLDDAEASRRLGVPAHGLDAYVAAIRECFEEAGLLVARDAEGHLLRPQALGPDGLTALRRAAAEGAEGLAAACRRLGLRLAPDLLGYQAHWLTPTGLPKRFDTRFFVTVAPPGQSALHDDGETVAHRWLPLQQALQEAEALRLANPTRHTLRALARWPTAQAAVDAAHAQPAVALIQPFIGVDERGPRPVMPHEPAYAEVARLDPLGRGSAAARIRPGEPVWLSPRILRLTAPNPGVMTGPGTNSYFVGDPGTNRWLLVDPGPADPVHLEALLRHAPGPLIGVLATHTHRDHSPGAATIARAAGVPVLGRRPAHPDGQDPDFAPDREPADGERLQPGPGTTLVLRHTPGHASNHLCVLLEEERTLFTGDHVMQGSTVVINPPDGDMAAYLASLQALRQERLDWLAPGHGFLIGRPAEVIGALIEHRLRREAKVLAALGHRPQPPATLVAQVYDDVPAERHGLAQRSLLAHLLKLRGEGRAVDAGVAGWQRA
jgi:glyoxylase-like metal-dependent hydrolase (beta-lactamase superfamily II)/8-oxo-dGTP pyrophosphatase MutT (NUDIX family)